MSFIQHGAAARRGIPLRRENVSRVSRAKHAARAGRERAPASRHRGAWRIGGLIGAAVFSVVCWGLAIQGIRAVIGLATAPPQIEAVARTVESPPEP